MPPLIRSIQKDDNLKIAKIIRTVLEEHNITMHGTAYHDASLDCMFEYYTGKNLIYYVIIDSNEVVGGAGIYPTQGLPQATCELVKMYILKNSRGKGYGKLLINKCIDFAKESGYKQVYLETMPELSSAIGMYENSGFTLLKGPMGNSGHFACEVRMIKKI